ncbi:hypothetical protein [Paenibacillus sp. PL2-23]|uniref:hypothetical protein n=1 Tax=Paenibacillus sp. PL2-23 TaxID=2100729 RepID=UPI0030FC073E
MDISNCAKCGGMIVKRRSYFCPACMEEMKEDIQRVRHYLRTHHRPNILDVHEMTGIPIRTIQQLIRAGIIEREQ